MTRSDYIERLYEFTTKASDLSRQVAFAGIAAVWIFAKTGNGSVRLPPELRGALLCFCVALVLDLVQHYYRSAATWLHFLSASRHAAPEDDDPDLGAPPKWATWPTGLFFWLKPVAVLWGLVDLIRFLP